METSPLKARLRSLLDLARERQLAQVAGLPASERDATGTLERWTAKDHLAHTIFWKEYMSERLAAAERGETPVLIPDYQPVNEANFLVNRDRHWVDLLAADARVHAELLARLDALEEDNLVDPERYSWRKGEPLVLFVLGNSFWHAQEHLAQYLSDRGDLDAATQTHETFVRETTSSSLPTIAHAYAVYNLACFYATTGRKEQALTNLAEALRLRPALAEWSQQDPDFATLRDEPGYQQLYTG
ncbi:MAG TPA: DinB family protein [Ktedonobacterales bacterium]|nr:DinB family protein [Ktedonobacterales bacterium]